MLPFPHALKISVCMKLAKFIALVALLAWCLFGTASLSTVRNPFEFIIPFLTLLLPFLLLLLGISSTYKNENARLYNLGKTAAVLCTIVSVAVLIFDFLR
jgi:hypothetical protein